MAGQSIEANKSEQPDAKQNQELVRDAAWASKICEFHDINGKLAVIFTLIEFEVAGSLAMSKLSGAELKTPVIGEVLEQIQSFSKMLHNVMTISSPPVALVESVDRQIFEGLVNIQEGVELMNRTIQRIIDKPEVPTSFLNAANVANQLKNRFENKEDPFEIHDFSRDLADAMRQIEVLYRQKNVQLEVVQARGKYEINARRYKMVEIIFELLKNALDMVDPATGRVFVSLSKDLLADNLNFMVFDNGPGIDEKKAELFFESGYTEKESGGTGFGLAIVKAEMESLGGSIRLSNANTGGCNSTLKIPLVKGFDDEAGNLQAVMRPETGKGHATPRFDTLPGIKIDEIGNED